MKNHSSTWNDTSCKNVISKISPKNYESIIPTLILPTLLMSLILPYYSIEIDLTLATLSLVQKLCQRIRSTLGKSRNVSIYSIYRGCECDSKRARKPFTCSLRRVIVPKRSSYVRQLKFEETKDRGKQHGLPKFRSGQHHRVYFIRVCMYHGRYRALFSIARSVRNILTRYNRTPCTVARKQLLGKPLLYSTRRGNVNDTCSHANPFLD